MDTGKFCIGWVKEMPLSGISDYVSIVPDFSGYRSEIKELVFTTQYLSVYDTYIEEGAIQTIDDLNMDLILTVDSIFTVSYFDIEMYKRFNDMNNQFN